MSSHVELAENYFMEGCNCAQAVFCAFEDVTGIDHDTMLRLGSSYGGGIGRLREVCGAFSAAVGILGLLYGYTDLEDLSLKARHYTMIQNLASDFRDIHGTIVCRELLKTLNVDTSPIPTPRTAVFHKVRPCIRFIRTAAELTDKVIREHESSES